jgi:hypothetical protein
VGVYVIPDPFAGVASLSFRTSAAIADLADGTYTSSDTLTFGDTTITSGCGIGDFSAGGYIIGTDTNGKKYMTSEIGKSFGVFELGTSDFTVAFVISAKDLDSNRLTYGVNPFDGFNIHFSTTIGWWPFDYPVSGLESSEHSNYTSADYCIYFLSFNQSAQQVTTILRTNTNHSHEITVPLLSNASTYGYSTASASSRTFSLVTGPGEDVAIRIYDMMIFPGEYMTFDRATYPIFGKIEDYVNQEYGIVIP